MMRKYFRKVGGLILTALLLPGIVVALSSAPASAQQRRVIIVRRPIYRPYSYWGWRRWDYDPYFDYYSRYGHYVFNNSDQAYHQGFNDGLKTGRNDSKDRKSYDPERSHYYQEAGFGNFGEVYRSGFLRGYDNGFRS
jgi:hypothetical protein